MTSLIKPNTGLRRSWLSNLLSDDFLWNPNFNVDRIPPVNIQEKDDEYEIDVALPGFKKQDINVNVKERVLEISSENQEENEESENGYTRKEFSFSNFYRSFTLPEDADSENVNAEFIDGVLQVHIQKSADQKSEATRKIEIS